MIPETRRAGRELDAIVAERVMGWTDVGMKQMWSLPEEGVGEAEPDGFELRGISPAGEGTLLRAFTGEDFVPHYSTSINAAWLVVEKLRTRGFYYDITDQRHGCYRFTIDGPPWVGFRIELVEAHAADEFPTGYPATYAAELPLAICLAALASLPVSGETRDA